MAWNVLLAISTCHGPRPQLRPPGHILQHWPPWKILNPTNPQANTLVLGLGGHLDFKGPLAPPTLSRALGPPPFIGGLGPKWNIWAI
ncbi:hypothetical protein O181_053161 [Austropuccinia psidii MF-1]|uniref:Uncharacterized protein n=1 Tax=Austropuccinia psidii MF-1 TaxID=1389203 RepID=A0A9Q3HPY4_9BASI|nr:hypothetical protein [Austropuccinia psidii MF-1]